MPPKEILLDTIDTIFARLTVMNLIIVESPTKARTLSRFLGKEYSVEATMGHIKDLPKEKLSVDVENGFKPNYVVVQKKSDVILAIQKAATKAKDIFIATDPDREGEAIAQHVEEVLSDEAAKRLSNKDKNHLITKSLNHSISRITFHEITKEAVEEAIGHPGKVNKDLVNAQIARRVLDRLVGYKLSPLLWKKVRRGLSAGRVQTVAVRLIVEREREIDAFKAEEYWEISCLVKGERQDLPTQAGLKENLEFIVKLIKIEGKTAKVENKEQADKVVADLNKSGYIVLDVRMKEVRKNPFPPFTTSTMTQAGARVFGWSAKRTMSLAQKLYEEGLITYHRTDSTNISQSALTEVRNYIGKNFGANYLPEAPRIYKKKSKLAQEAHEAIRPTSVNVTAGEIRLSGDKYLKDSEKLYGLIWKKFVASQMEACVFDETVIDVEAKVDLNYLLRASGQVMKFDGWRKVIPLNKDEEPELPQVLQGEALKMLKVIADQKFTQPPARYNEASLIKTLEKLGIGRPSTYAPIITTIQTRAYVEKNEGKFFPTPVGIAVTDFLVTNFSDLFDYSFTAGMELKLDNITTGEVAWKDMMGEFYKPFEGKLTDVEKNAQRVKIEAEKLGRKCQTCEKEGRTGDKQGDLVIRTGRFGKFISCSIFPECKHTERYVEKAGMKCPKCKKGDVIVKNTKARRKFFGCSRYPKCDFASWQKPNLTRQKPGKKGKN